MKSAILACVGKRSFTTFQDLTREVPGLAGVGGMFTPLQPALIIWHAVSEEGIATLGDLIGSKAIYMHPAPRVSYRADLNLPPVPVSRRIEYGQSTELKWFPVVFTLTPEIQEATTF